MSSSRVTLQYEESLWAKGVARVAGIDEAGRGPLAGPVVAAAVVMPQGFFLPNVDDSKRLTGSVRAELYAQICAGAAGVGIGIVGHAEIDRVNILNATLDAMEQAVAALPEEPEFLLIDGNRYGRGRVPHATIIGGDALCFSVAAASIVAKVTRDRLMVEFDREFPGYGFARHKGYGTREHREAILRQGFCPIHRRTFTRRLAVGPVCGT